MQMTEHDSSTILLSIYYIYAAYFYTFIETLRQFIVVDAEYKGWGDTDHEQQQPWSCKIDYMPWL